MNNSIYIRRKSKLYINKENSNLSDDYIFNLLKNIEGLGYTLSVQLIETINTLPLDKFKIFYYELISALKENVGAHVKFEPMYPNFPEQVKNATEEELYSNALWHYLGDWIGLRIIPKYEKNRRAKLKDNVTLKVIDLGTEEDFNSIFTNLLNSKTSISETDKKDVEWFIQIYREDIKKLIPDEISLKENAALLIGSLIKENIEAQELIDKYVKTSTDVLRIATALSNGDISLAQNTKFQKISKKNRKLLLQALEKSTNIIEDMLRYKEKWKRLGESLHPFEYKNLFPKCYEAFDTIRNDKLFETYYGKVEKYLLNKDINKAVNLLKTRPGEFARRLDKLIRETDNFDNVISEFNNVADKVSTPVLLQVMHHFKTRNKPKELRTFFPKGNVAKTQAIDNNLPVINETVCNKIVSVCENALISKFRKYRPLGKVYLDEKLKNYTVPFALRSASKALETIGRGSKIDFPEGNTIRFFIYWKDGIERTDLDLSALALDSDSKFIDVISYYNLKTTGGYHSGDITSAPDGASEFIDIDISKFLKKGIRYVLMMVNSFTQQAYCDLPICFAGFMIRQFPNSGEIYEPSTVKNKFDLTADTKIAIPLILDLQEKKVIWTDLALKANLSTANNVHNNMSSSTLVNKSITSLEKPVLYDLFDLHIKARGERTDNINNAETIFSLNKGIKPTDIDIIISEYL